MDEGLLWFCQNDFYSPVVKHGQRTLYASERVRNSYTEWKWKVCNRKMTTSTNRVWSVWVWAYLVGPRKMVNYAWIGRSLEKCWWRLEAVLTCKSLIKFEYRGKRLIEPSRSWLRKKTSIDIKKNAKDLRRIRAACEKAKRALSTATQTTVILIL